MADAASFGSVDPAPDEDYDAQVPTAAADGVVEVIVSQGRPGLGRPRPSRLRLDTSTPHHVACHNPRCHGGGLEATSLVRELVRETSGELRVVACEGRTRPAAQRTRSAGWRCDTLFCVRLASTAEEDR